SGGTAAKVQVATKNAAGLGQVLVDSKGKTLYSFIPDHRSKVKCVGACAAVWPPLKIASGQTPVATGQAKTTLMGSDPDPSGGRASSFIAVRSVSADSGFPTAAPSSSNRASSWPADCSSSATPRG